MRRTNKKYVPIAKGQVRFFRLVWLLVAALCLVVLTGSMFFVLTKVNLPSQKTYVGALRPSQDKISIQLPANAALDKVLVSYGSNVFSGQTVATFNIDEMEREKQLILQNITFQNLLLDCLFEKRNGPISAESDRSQIVPEILRADTACQLVFEPSRIKLDDIERQRKVLIGEMKILSQYIRLITAEEFAENTERAEHALALSLARNRVEARLINLDNLIATVVMEQKTSVQMEISQVIYNLAEMSEALQQIKDHIAEPRIYAQRSGTVNRVRPVASNVILKDPVEIIEISPTESPVYYAYFNIPLQDADTLPLGTKVSINTLGSIRNLGRYYGVVGNITEHNAGFVQVQIVLERESLIRLADPNNGIAFYGQSTATTIELKRSDYNLADLLLESSQGFVSWVTLK